MHIFFLCRDPNLRSYARRSNHLATKLSPFSLHLVKVVTPRLIANRRVWLRFHGRTVNVHGFNEYKRKICLKSWKLKARVGVCLNSLLWYIIYKSHSARVCRRSGPCLSEMRPHYYVRLISGAKFCPQPSHSAYIRGWPINGCDQSIKNIQLRLSAESCW